MSTMAAGAVEGYLFGGGSKYLQCLQRKEQKNQKLKEQNVKDGDNYTTMTTINRTNLLLKNLSENIFDEKNQQIKEHRLEQ